MNAPRFLEDIALLLARLQQAPGQVHVRVWQELSPWLRNLVSTASLKWVERLGAGEQCHIVTLDAATGHRCRGAAIAYCVACKKPTCLTHAFVDGSGEAVCFACATELITHKGAAPPNASSNGQRPPVPPDPKDVAWARRLFKIKASATWAEVRAAHRKLSARWHPDKVQDDAGKLKAEAKFKELGRAYEILKKEYGE